MKTLKHLSTYLSLVLLLTLSISCKNQNNQDPTMNQHTPVVAANIFENPNTIAISYGGYRETSREIQPTVEQLMEDMKIMHAMGIRLLRTYNVHFPHASNVLKAIDKIQQQDPDFEMYVMLGAWINCQGAFTDNPNHYEEDEVANQKEIDRAVELANQYPHIIASIAVGNEAMVKWAESYYVQPGVILKYVNQLQELKEKGKLSKDLWITSSDNFASWGGGGSEYHVPDLNKLIHAVDFISVHTYPMHDTHYNPDFWKTPSYEANLSEEERIEAAMQRSLKYAQNQYKAVVKYMKAQGADKPVHIGETGWATVSNEHYGPNGSRACDEYKSARFYQLMSQWTQEENIKCFYFQAFDEPWKDAANPKGSENHFGLFTVDGQAKLALWDLVDQGVFEGLSRNGNSIKKTHNGNIDKIMSTVLPPPLK